MPHTSPTQPLCHYCGKPIAKATETVYCRDPHGRRPDAPGPFYSKAECQTATNQQVVSVSYSQDYNWLDDEPEGPRYVHRFTTWDGESYVDEFFCNGHHAQLFAYVMARAGRCTNHYNEAVARRSQQQTSREKPVVRLVPGGVETVR